MGIDVLVPVLGRPSFAEPLAESLSVTITPYRLIWLCSPHDLAEIAACEGLGEVLVVPWPAGKADFAKKINYGFEHSDSEWIFQGADDIAFSEGWDTHALAVAAKTRKRVIGTNDLHNPAVRQGKHSTHTLIHRSYVEEYPAEHGKVFCELYDHQYVDNEFIELARRRGEFISSPNSIVEHFHPHWGNREVDATHKKATRQTNADRRLYFQRMRGAPRATRVRRRA